MTSPPAPSPEVEPRTSGEGECERSQHGQSPLLTTALCRQERGSGGEENASSDPRRNQQPDRPCSPRAAPHQPTPAEEKLWEALRGRRLAGLKFRRQHPFGPFVLDMFCVEHQLVIEVDGSIHMTPEQAIYDAARTEHLMERGLRILRFTNDEVEHHLPDVLNRILQNIAS